MKNELNCLEQFYIAFKPFIWILGFIIVLHAIPFIYLCIKESKPPHISRLQELMKSIVKSMIEPSKKKLTNKERLDKTPQSEKAKIMFQINKRIEQEKNDNLL